MKVTVSELVESTHAKELAQVAKLQDEIAKIESFISGNENSEDAKVLLELQVAKNKSKRLNFELEKLQDELAQIKEEASKFWNSANVAQWVTPKIARMEKALEALGELKSDDARDLEAFKESLALNLREAKGKLSPWMQQKDTAPSEWVKLVS